MRSARSCRRRTTATGGLATLAAESVVGLLLLETTIRKRMLDFWKSKTLTSSSYRLVSIFLYLSAQSRVLEGVGFPFLSFNSGPLWGRPAAYAGGLGRGTWWTRFQIIRYDFTNVHAFLLLSRKVSFPRRGFWLWKGGC
jgi:hypothetical protein